MHKRVIAFGDVHGCVKPLRALLATIQPTREDTLVFLGDCVDYGSASREVISELVGLQEKCRLVPILGNHEEMMIRFLEGRTQADDWLQCGGKETLDSYGGVDHPEAVWPEHIEFIQSWRDVFETNRHFFIHGSYDEEVPLTAQCWNILRWQSLREVVPGVHCSGKTAIVGHTSQTKGEILDLGYLVCIDTYCRGTGWLTALEAETGQIWQADRKGCLRK
jgi:serine/threonine protein phosphatase 1